LWEAKKSSTIFLASLLFFIFFLLFIQKKVPLHSVFVTKEEKNVGKVKKSWRFRKKR